jgi:hypothetical protein
MLAFERAQSLGRAWCARLALLSAHLDSILKLGIERESAHASRLSAQGRSRAFRGPPEASRIPPGSINTRDQRFEVVLPFATRGRAGGLLRAKEAWRCLDRTFMRDSKKGNLSR